MQNKIGKTNNYFSIISIQWYRIDEFKKKATNYCIRSLVMVRNQSPAQVVTCAFTLRGIANGNLHRYRGRSYTRWIARRFSRLLAFQEAVEEDCRPTRLASFGLVSTDARLLGFSVGRTRHSPLAARERIDPSCGSPRNAWLPDTTGDFS